jgi:regulator of protease activity HflC (stomatin/prohibitin superfamily)
MVIYGKVGQDATGQRSSKCVHGGAAFIWPVFQSYEFLSLTPISINVDLRNALSKQNIRIDVPSRFTVGISTETGVMQNAAERLLGLKQDEVEALAMDIIFGQLRLVVATMDIEEINTDRDKFLDAVSRNVERTSPATLRRWARKRPPRPSMTRRRAWPRRTATVPSVRRKPRWTNASVSPRRTPPPLKAKIPPK